MSKISDVIVYTILEESSFYILFFIHIFISFIHFLEFSTIIKIRHSFLVFLSILKCTKKVRSVCDHYS